MSEMGIRERVTNILLLLYLIEQANAKGKVEDELKLQKLVFLAQNEFVKRRLKAFSYNFFRWRKGPFSKNLRIDLITVLQSNFVKEESNRIELTDKAREVLENCSELFTENKHFLKWIDSIADKYSKYPSDDIKEFVYSLQVMVPKVRRIMAIQDISPSQLILFKTSDKKARGIFRIDESWLATLELTFDKEARESLARAADDAAEGRAYELNV